MKPNPRLILVALLATGGTLQAATVAWWRFEDGTAGSNVARGGQANGVF